MPVFHTVPTKSLPPLSGFNPDEEKLERRTEEMMDDARETASRNEPGPFLLDPIEVFSPALGLQSEEEATAAAASQGATIQAPDQPTDIPAASEDPALEPEERPTIRFGKFDLGSMRLRIPGQDVRMGFDAGEGLNTVVGAVLDTAANTAQGLDLITQALGAPEGALATLARKIPKVAASNSGRTRTVRGMLQFYLAFAPALGVARNALLASTAGTKLAVNMPLATDLATTGAADAIATWFSFDGDEDTLAETIDKFAPSLKETPWYADIMSYVMSEPGDTEAERRWKNVLEGQIANVFIGAALAPKRAVKEFGMLVEGMRRSQTLRTQMEKAPLKYLANETGGVGPGAGGPRDIPGGRMNPENAMPFVRGEMRDALRERERLTTLLNETPQNRKYIVQGQIDSNNARIEALTASQQHHQERLVQMQAEERVSQIGARITKLRERAENQERIVTETVDSLGDEPTRQVRNKLSRQRGKLRRTQAEIAEQQSRLDEAMGALEGTAQRSEQREISMEEILEGGRVIEQGEEARVPSILGEGPNTAVDPLSRNALPLTDEAAEFLLANKDFASDVPVRDQFFQRLKVFSRKGGPAKIETLNRQAEELGIPINKLDELLPGQGVSTEHLAALVGTLRDTTGKFKRAADAWANNPTDPHLERIFDEQFSDFSKVYSAMLGQESEAGASLFAAEHFQSQLEEIGAVRLSNLISKHGGTISKEDKLYFAKLASVTPGKRLGRFLSDAGKQTKRKKWADAISEAFISSRFLPSTVLRNDISQSIMLSSEVGSRILAGAISDLGLAGRSASGSGSDVTMTEGIKLGMGMINGLRQTGRLIADHKLGFSPALDYGSIATKLDAPRVPGVSSQGLELDPDSVVGGLVDAAGYTLRTVSRQMVFHDKIFQSVARSGQRQALAWREAVKETRELAGRQTMTRAEKSANIKEVYKRLINDFPEYMENQVQRWGEYTSFADNFDPHRGGFIEPVGAALQKWQKEHPLSKILFPFIRTSMRIRQATLKRFPLVGEFIRDTDEWITHNPADQRALARGKQAMGGMILALGLYARANGWLMGERPGRNDPKARELYRQQGYRDQSLVVEQDENGKPTKVIPLQGISEPLGLVLRMGAAYGDVLDLLNAEVDAGIRDESEVLDLMEYLNMTGQVFARMWEDQTFFAQNLKLVQMLADGQGDAAQRFIANLQPAAFRETGDILSPVAREAEGFLEQLKAQSPFWRDDLATSRDYLGETYVRGYGKFPEEAPPGYAEQISRVFNPVAATGDWGSKWKPIRDFLDDNIDISVGLSEVKNIRGVKLNSEQRATYMAMRGGATDFTLPDGRKIPPVRINGKTMRETLLQVVQSNTFLELGGVTGKPRATARAFRASGLTPESLKRSVFASVHSQFTKATTDFMMSPASPFPELWEQARALQMYKQSVGGF